jgi:hypothetical protein
MNNVLIAQKLRELASLFDEVQEASKPVQEASKPVQEASITLDTIRVAMAQLLGEGKRDKVIAILSVVGVKKVSDLTEDKFAETMVQINDAR